MPLVYSLGKWLIGVYYSVPEAPLPPSPSLNESTNLNSKLFYVERLELKSTLQNKEMNNKFQL